MSKSLADQIRELVIESGIRPAQISRETGIDRSALSRFVSGERGLSLASLDKLAAALRLRVVSDREGH